jgi:large-conductance mechanosensitive channel
MEQTSHHLNLGDILFQLFSFGALLGTAIIIFLVIKSSNKSKSQTKEMTEKISRLEQKIHELTEKKED